MKSLPVVFIESNSPKVHGVEPDWFNAAILQAQKFNQRVIHIGDHKAADYNLHDYLRDGTFVLQDYVHLSRNHEAFEKFCIMRWFVLRDWMTRENEPVVLYLDSDVLLYANAQKEWDEKWYKYLFTLSLKSSPATSFITLASLYEFCAFVAKIYNERGPIFNEMERVFKEMLHQNLPGGISDMYLWNQFALRQKQPPGEMTDIINGSTWDHNINVSDGFEVCDGHKAVHLIENKPYAHHVASETLIRFNALHFQGGAKKFLHSYVSRI